VAGNLKVVTEADAPAAPPNSLKDAAEQSERALLVRMRTTIAVEIDNGVPAHALASLIRQLRDVDKEIRLLDQRASEEARDDRVSADEDWDETAI
jgi:hypothetical protein